jgi:hypothetical protein
MAQTLYGFIALGLVMILSLNTFRIITETQRTMAINEVATQITGVSMEILDHIGNRYFDHQTNPKFVFPKPPTYPYVTGESQLTGPGAAEWGVGTSGCPQGALKAVDDCDDIDDFDGMVVTRDVDGLNYTATISVQYVSTCTLQPSGRSFAKEVEVTVVTPDALIGGSQLQVTVSRVFTYNRITCLTPLTCSFQPCSP